MGSELIYREPWRLVRRRDTERPVKPRQSELGCSSELPNTWRGATGRRTEKWDLRTVEAGQKYEYYTNGDGSG
jgi:hypothetical protein